MQRRNIITYLVRSDKNRRATCTLVKYCGIENNNDKVWKMGEAYKEQSDSTTNG